MQKRASKVIVTVDGETVEAMDIPVELVATHMDDRDKSNTIFWVDIRVPLSATSHALMTHGKTLGEEI